MFSCSIISVITFHSLEYMQKVDVSNNFQGIFPMQRSRSAERNRFGIAIFLSILIHLLLLILIEYDVVTLRADNQILPVVEEEKRIVFEIVESNPDFAIDSPKEDAELASDKNTIASDITPETTFEADRPITDGISDSKELPVPESHPDELMQKTLLAPREKFDTSRLLERPEDNRKETQEKQEQNESEKIQAVLPDNQDTSARNDLGGFSLSTYAWEFAPYMLELKRKIGKNIHPPKAFTDFGIISGSYVIQFVITRKGELQSVNVVDVNETKQFSENSSPLLQTSINAIQFSKPFEPLPDDFPDDLLIITGTFNYLIKF